MTQNYINHIAFVLDASGSMQHLTNDVRKVAENQIAHLAKRSTEVDQETRVTVYSFSDNNKLQCLVYDKDVLRVPSLALYRNQGAMTALIDATLKAISDLSETPQQYGEHAFLIYVLTDGLENASSSTPDHMKAVIETLADNYTVAVFVPNQDGVFEAKKFGFPAQNIAVWDTTKKGVGEVGEAIRQTTETFMTGRVKGVRGYKNLFTIDTTALSPKNVGRLLSKLKPGQFRILPIEGDSPMSIAAFVEHATGRPYKLGEAYYQLTKPVIIQPQKDIALFHKKEFAVYTGKEARTLLGLPATVDVRVQPTKTPDYDIYVQSTSTNRKLFPGTNLLILS